MHALTLSEIEGQIRNLSLNEQLWLMERLVHQIREKSTQDQIDWENGLAVMAADREIQNELQTISDEFSQTEMDGLGNM
jgi:hypothetical protein